MGMLDVQFVHILFLGTWIHTLNGQSPHLIDMHRYHVIQHFDSDRRMALASVLSLCIHLSAINSQSGTNII